MAGEKKVLGSRMLLAVNMGTDLAPDWKIPLCQVSLTVNRPKNVIDSSSKCGPDSDVEDAAETVDFEGQILKVNAEDTNHLDTVALHEILDDMVDRQWKSLIKDATAADNGSPQYTFTGKLSNLTDSYPNGEKGTQTGSIAVSGKVDVTPFTYTT